MSPRLRDFEKQKDEIPLRCEIIPYKPRLDFGFRFQSGYIVRTPSRQFAGEGHVWAILVKIVPDNGNPVYLGSRLRLPPVKDAKSILETSGSFLLGEGNYRVDLLLSDEQGRTCRKGWDAAARLSRGDRDVKLRIPAGAVWSLFARHDHAGNGEAQPSPAGFRYTILLHAAPLFPRSNRFHAYDRELLLGSVAAMTDLLPAESVRLVVFNLDQQKEFLRQDNLSPDNFESMAQKMAAIELGTVDLRVLQNPGGGTGLLADLVNKEIRASKRSDAVIFLGPALRKSDRLPMSAVEEPGPGPAPRFFYFQYEPFLRRGGRFPDTLQNAVKALKGKTITITTPADFARGIREVRGLRP